MITTFRTDELVGALSQCSATAGLAGRVTKLVKAMNAVLDGARAASITNTKAQRDAAAALVRMLAEIDAISDANDQAAATIGGGTTAGASGSPGAGTDWTAAANAYLEETFDTYATVDAAASDLRRLDPAAVGLTATESATRGQQATVLVDRAATAVDRHLQGLQVSRAQPCYADALDADRAVASQRQGPLVDGAWPGDATAEARATAGAWAETVTRTATFLDRCRRSSPTAADRPRSSLDDLRSLRRLRPTAPGPAADGPVAGLSTGRLQHRAGRDRAPTAGAGIRG